MGRMGELARVLVALAAALTAVGCQTPSRRAPVIVPADAPKETEKVSLPDYRVEPPDILVIEASRTIPKPPYKAEPLDVLHLHLAAPLPNEPLTGLFNVDPEGTLTLGPSYGGSVKVRGLTLPEIKATVEKHLAATVGLKSPVVTVTLAQSRAVQRIAGPHLVRPDGTIGLGTYGSLRVAGMTLAEIRHSVEALLSEQLLEPEITVDVQSYNSKLYYVILDGAGAGQTVYRLPVTGNDTVLDAMAQVTGLTTVSDPDRMWVARPAAAGTCPRVMPVDWKALSECGDPGTNYQLMPGDRLYVGSNKYVAADIRLSRFLAPVERVLGITLLGNSTVRSVGAPWNSGFFNNTGANSGFVR